MACSYFGMGQTSRSVSAVTAACMLVRLEVCQDLGGFEEWDGIAFTTSTSA